MVVIAFLLSPVLEIFGSLSLKITRFLSLDSLWGGADFPDITFQPDKKPKRILLACFILPELSLKESMKIEETEAMH